MNLTPLERSESEEADQPQRAENGLWRSPPAEGYTVQH